MDELPQVGCIAVNSNLAATDKASNLIYHPLPHGHIRLLQILPGNAGSRICCLLKPFSLDNKPRYVALSYTWGCEPSEHCIQLNGIDFCIRKNLWRFLSQARTAGMHDLFWIDAICINQTQNSEKMVQINLMPRIYSIPMKVLIWLGPAYAGSDEAINELRNARWPPKRLNALWVKPRGTALQYICARSYWKRLWIVQELLLAPSAEIMCGSQVIPFDLLKAFLSKVGDSVPNARLQDKENFMSVRNSSALSIIRQMTTYSDKTLWNLLLATQNQRCAVKQDKVFALLSIAKAGQEEISPDYSMPIPILLNKVLKSLHQTNSPSNTEELANQSKQLAQLLAVDEASVFTIHQSPDEPLAPGDRKIDDFFLFLWSSFYAHSAIARMLLDSGNVKRSFEPDDEAICNATTLRLLLDGGRDYFDWREIFLFVARLCRRDLIKLLLNSNLHEVPPCLADGSAPRAAAMGGHGLDAVRLMLDAGADISAVNDSGRSVLSTACSSHGEQLELVKLLLDRGAGIYTCRSPMDSPLCSASAMGHREVVKLLLDSGVGVNAHVDSKDGSVFQSALRAASANGHLAVVKLLLDYGGNVDVNKNLIDDTRYIVSVDGNRELPKLTSRDGADERFSWANAIKAAACNGHREVVRLLIDSRPDDEDFMRCELPTVLWAVCLLQEERLEMVKLLLDCGVDVNAHAKAGPAALHAASKSGHIEVVKLLLEAGADVNDHVTGESSAIHAASMHGHREVVKLLLDSGADVIAHGKERPDALHAASMNGHIEVVKLLLSTGTDFNRYGGKLDIALCDASMCGHQEVEKLLLDSGARINGYRSKRARSDHRDLVELLLDAGAEDMEQRPKSSLLAACEEAGSN